MSPRSYPHPDRHRPVSADEARARDLGAVRGILIALAWSSAFWLLFVILPIAWHNGWRP